MSSVHLVLIQYKYMSNRYCITKLCAFVSVSRSSQPLRRASSSSSADEVIKTVEGLSFDGSNKDKIAGEQEEILAEIKANQWEKVEHVNGGTANVDDHFNASGSAPITVQPGQSNFYTDWRTGPDMGGEAHDISRQPVASAYSTHYMSGMYNYFEPMYSMHI